MNESNHAGDNGLTRRASIDIDITASARTVDVFQAVTLTQAAQEVVAHGLVAPEQPPAMRPSPVILSNLLHGLGELQPPAA